MIYEYAKKLIGVPYAFGGRNVEKLDCFGVLYLSLLHCYGERIGNFPSSKTLVSMSDERFFAFLDTYSEPCDIRDGCIVVSNRPCGYVRHVGIVGTIPEEMVIHTGEGLGSVTEVPLSLVVSDKSFFRRITKWT